MQVFRDLSFDYAERVENDQVAGVEFNLSHDPRGDHVHCWIPREWTKEIKGSIIDKAHDEALSRFNITSMSWDEKPSINLR